MTRVPDALRIAIVFYGITRSLRFTLPSIEERVIAPVRAVAGEVALFGHFYDQSRIDNPRTGETGALDPDEYRLLNLDRVERELPETCLATYPMSLYMAPGDRWGDGFKTLRNLVHQLHSLRRATLMAENWGADLVVFARPDLLYLTSLEPDLRALAEQTGPCCVHPDWSQWQGVNDRMALALGAEAIHAVGHRVERIAGFCSGGRKLQAERLLGYALEGIPRRLAPIHVARVRSDGRVVQENFTPGHGTPGEKPTIPFAEYAAAMAKAKSDQPLMAEARK
jgi:hypothetical protein